MPRLRRSAQPALALCLGVVFAGPTATAGAVTLAPTFTSPATNATTSSPIAVSYALPELALSNSVTLTFTPSGGGSPIVVTLGSAVETAGSHAVNLTPAALTPAANVVSASPSTIPDGTYDVTLSYRNALADPAASVTHTGVKVDTTTVMPALTSPSSGATISTSTVPVRFTLGETAQAGSVKLVLVPQSRTAAGTRTLVLSQTAAGAGEVTLNRANLAAGAGVSSVTGETTLPDGTYRATLQAKDALGNPLATTAGVDFTLSTPSSTDPGTTPAPTPSTPEPATPPQAKTTAAPWSARWTLRRGARGVTLRAAFAAVAGAQRYTLTARRGKKVVRGTCRTRACSVLLPRGGGRWKIALRALGPSGTLATVQHRVGEPAKRVHPT